MELETVNRRCHCERVAFPVSIADAKRIDKGETGLRCGNACWGIYLARNSGSTKGKK